MKLHFFFFLFLLVFGKTGAQTYQSKVDSVETIVQKHISEKEYQKALSALHDLSNLNEFEGDWDLYHKTVERMFELSEKIGDKHRLVECLNKLGISSCLIGQNKEAIGYFLQTLDLAQELNDEGRIANTYENLGLVYRDLADYERALDYQLKSLRIREKTGNERIVNNYTNISQLFSYLKQPDKQEEYLKRAISADKTLKPSHSRSAIICCEYGEFLMEQQKYDSAFHYFEEGLAHTLAENWKKGIAVFLGNLAELHMIQGNVPKSIEMHLETLKLSEDINDCVGICQELNSLTKLYILEKDFAKASEMNRRAIEKTLECNLGLELAYAYRKASELAEKMKNYEKSLGFYKKYHALTDSLFNLDKQNALAELDKQYQTEKKNQEINLLKAENDLQNQKSQTLLIMLIAAILLVVIFVLLFFRKKNASKRKEEVLKQQLLLSQMNPHFVFNALGSIQSFMYKNDARKAAAFLGNFASLTRSILQNSTEEYVSLAEEIETLKNYIELEKMRLQDHFSYEIIMDESLDAEFIDLPPMLIQPFVENAINHGLKEKETDGKLLLSFKEKHNLLQICIEDNGKGVKHGKPQHKAGHKSMSMKIFEERRKIIGSKLRKNVEFSIVDLKELEGEKEGTLVKICIPIKYSDQ